MAEVATTEKSGKVVIKNIGLLLSGDIDKPILDADTIVVHDGLITAVGKFKDCGPGDEGSYQGTWTWQEVVADRLGKLGIPVLAGLRFGHVADKSTFPVGVLAELDVAAGTLALPALRAAVLDLGPISGRLIAESIVGEPTLVDLTPFRAERFGGQR